MQWNAAQAKKIPVNMHLDNGHVSTRPLRALDLPGQFAANEGIKCKASEVNADYCQRK